MFQNAQSVLAMKDEALVKRKRVFVHQLCVRLGSKVSVHQRMTSSGVPVMHLTTVLENIHNIKASSLQIHAH